MTTIMEDTNIPRLPPPVRGHSRSQTIDLSSPNRSSTYLPFWNSSRSPSPQRSTTSNANSTVSLPLTKPDVKRLTSWFEGSSQPVNIGLVASQNVAEDQAVTSIMSNPAMSSSRFSFFRKQSSVSALSAEGLETLNIQDTLFPHGPVDEFSPASFKNLHQNAEGGMKLLRQALRETRISLDKATAQKDDLSEDLEAEQIRNEHLKAQLVDMANKAAEQERIIAALQSQNEQLRANEVSLRSIRVITDESQDVLTSRRKRTSDVSIDSAGTDLSSAPSIFSYTDGLSSAATSIICPSPELKCTRPEIKHAASATPKIGTTEHLRSLTTNVMVTVPDCQKCRSPKSNEAADMLSVMIAENAGLKQYIQQMESEREDIADLCAWDQSEMLDLNNKCARMIGGAAGLRMLDEEAQDQLRDGCIV